MVTVLLYLVAVAIAGVRVYGEKGWAFKTIAHLFVFVLIGMAIKERDRGARWHYIGVAAALSVVEVACFLLSRASP